MTFAALIRSMVSWAPDEPGCGVAQAVASSRRTADAAVGRRIPATMFESGPPGLLDHHPIPCGWPIVLRCQGGWSDGTADPFHRARRTPPASHGLLRPVAGGLGRRRAPPGGAVRRAPAQG